MPTRNTRFSNLLTLMAALSAGAAFAQPAQPLTPQMRGDGPPPSPKPFSITRADKALDALVAPNAKAELIASGFGLNEGPVWVPEGRSGYLLVGGLLDNVIYKITTDKNVSVFMEQAGYTGTDVSHTGAQTRSGRSHVLLIGPSCASLDSQGRLIWCADNDRTVMRLEKDGTRTVLSAGAPDGKRFSGPNDIAVARDDAVYLTDNDFGLRDAGRSPDKQMPNGVWRIKDGQSNLVLDAATLGGIPNGVALSPDERYLYLTALSKMMRYEVKADGSLGTGSVFTEGPGIGDGMKVDVQGNVYSTSGAGPGIVRITAPTGKLLGLLNLPIYGGEPKRQICATNVAFGDTDGKSLYVTACDAVYKIRLKVAGVMPGPKSVLAQTSPVAAACNLAAAPGVTNRQLMSGGRPRSYRLFVPPGYNGRAPFPLVLDLHGSGGTAAGQASNSRFEALAAREGFLVASLQADNSRWNVPVADGRPDDVAYASDVIDDVAAEVCTDLARVYATGFSGGARMSSLLGCRLGARLAAIAPMSGLRWPGPCEGRAIPVLTLHGLADPQNTYAGHAEGRGAEWFESVPEALAAWAQHNGCAANVIDEDPPGPLSTLRYEGCRDGAEVRLIRIDGLVHAWARDEVDATAVMWEFFKSHTLN